MAYKQSKHLFQGMSKDLSDDKQKGIYYIDAHNIRITAREDTTLLSVTNEKGNTKLIFQPADDFRSNIYAGGQYIGHAVLNDYLILFIKQNDGDAIWRMNMKTLKSEKLYLGNLNFSTDSPIETLVDYETDSIQKVYWTDGKNQPRLINIVNAYVYSGNGVDAQFDFVPEVYPDGTDTLRATVEKYTDTTGMFASGTIQYFITYYNKFGQESNVVWQSPLLYTSPRDRGGAPNEVINNSFKITIENPTGNFDYIRVYAVQHTSTDTDLIGRRVADLDFPASGESVEIVDNGSLGESINPADLYYKGGIPTAIGTMSAKDQTLFLGNITLKNKEKIDTALADRIRASLNVHYTKRDAMGIDNYFDKYYAYNNQLVTPGAYITTYKTREKYRFGLQFQDKWGRWSEPIFLADVVNDQTPSVERIGVTPREYQYRTFLAQAESIFSDTSLIRDLTGTPYYYVKVRPLVVLPTENERECLAQGVVNSTVFNLGDRISNTPFAQPSWFFRPYIKNENILTDSNGYADVNNGAYVPFRHNSVIQGRNSIQGEIQNGFYAQYHSPISMPELSTPTTNEWDNAWTSEDPVKLNEDTFFVDNSIVTLDSADLGETVSDENYNFRIIGLIPITGMYGHYYLEATDGNRQSWRPSANFGNALAPGYTRYDLAIQNLSDTYGGNILCTPPSWMDAPYTSTGEIEHLSWTTTAQFYRFPLYPWQSTGALNNSQSADKIQTDTIPQTAQLEYKCLSNIRYSYNTLYFDTVECDYSNDIAVDFVNDTKTTIQLEDVTYYSSIDKLLNIADHDYESFAHTRASYQGDNYYPGFVVYPDATSNSLATKLREVTKYKYTKSFWSDYTHNGAFEIKNTATSIQYKTSPHAVIALKNTEYNNAECQNILPTISDGTRNFGMIGASYTEYEDDIQQSITYYRYSAKLVNSTSANYTYELRKTNDLNVTYPSTYFFNGKATYPWNKNIKYISQKRIQVAANLLENANAFLFLGELYRPNIENKFGGTSDEAIKQNTWIPAGESQNLYNNMVINWKEGDTYFQRWDCLKTYPYSSESENNVVEILSFMCETRTNIAGRYDKNRGLTDNTFITNENFNLINTGYTQSNNFFSYKILDERFNEDAFRNQLTWTTIKSAGAITDNWTNVVLQNTLDLDGDKGELISLNRYKNDIVAFQPKGISQIIYNPNVQVNTTSGLPIEIANSGKVQGKRYLYEGVGCSNKWSICDEAYGSLYFMDNLNKSIYKLNDQGLVSLTDTKGFRAWMEEVSTTNMWSPYVLSLSTSVMREAPKGFRTFYDKTYKDVYFVNNKTCLVYSDLLDQFVSFMDYQNTDGMVNIGDNFYALYNKDMWQQFAGKYNEIYGQYRDYDITFLDNLQPEMNKIFTNLEFRSDTYDRGTLVNDRTFNRVRIYDEYQDSNWVSLNTLIDRPYLSDIQKKFRVWRVQLPRDKDNPLNRINNTWARITLKRTKPELQSDERIVLHDAVVGYYI